MLCPEGEPIQNEPKKEEVAEKLCKEDLHTEGSGSVELKSYKNPKTWKKSITNFFRHQLRSTKSNDGDQPTGSKENFEEKDISPEQKWQSLGKIFRRQSFAEHWGDKSPHQHGESSTQNKRLGVRKVISSYFGKNQKSTDDTGDEN